MRKYFLTIALISSYVSYGQSPAYRNKQLSPDVRAKDLLARMTLEEKVMQTQCFWGQKAGLLNEAGGFDEAKASVGIDAGALSFYDKDMKWVVEPGTFTIMAGTASDKTTSVSLTVIP